MNKIVCSPIVLMISRSSMSYRGESSCDPSSSDVVSPDMVYELLSLVLYIGESCRFIFPVHTVDTWKERKRTPVQRIRSTILRPCRDRSISYSALFDSLTSVTRVFFPRQRARTESTRVQSGIAREARI